MNFFSGSQLAVAIEDLANQQLLESEDVLAERIVQELTTALPIHAGNIPKKLINGFMRGSTSFKEDQLAYEISLLGAKLGLTIGDLNDALSIVTHIKYSLERERKDIHIRRTQKSAIKQVLRFLKEDLDDTNPLEPFDLQEFKRKQQDLLELQISDPGEIYFWADHVLHMYHGVFVDFGGPSGHSNRKQKNKISESAATNYSNAWMRFIENNSRLLCEKAQISKPLPQHFSNISNYQKPQETSFDMVQTFNASQTIRVLIENSGQGAIKFEKTWASKSEARKDLKAFLSLLNTLVDSNERIDLFEVSIESTNGISLTLHEVFQPKIEETLNQVLAD